MIVTVGVFLVANGVLDFVLASRSRNLVDYAIAVAGMVLGVLVLTGRVA